MILQTILERERERVRSFPLIIFGKDPKKTGREEVTQKETRRQSIIGYDLQEKTDI